MPDVKEVINGLEMSYKYSNVDENNTLVPQWIVLHALALLKEQEKAIKFQSDRLDELLEAQEPVKPVLQNHETLDGIIVFNCGACGCCIGFKGIAKYCMKCGQEVKWE